MISEFIKSFPFYYYLSSRYSYFFERVIFLIKYFGFYFILLFVLGFTPDYYYVLITLLVLLLFYNIYDFFCYLNDLDDIPEYRKDNRIDVDYDVFKKLKVFYFLLFNIIVFISFGVEIGALCLALQFCLTTLFWMHNKSTFPVKLITFTGLYFLKIVIFVVGLISYQQLPILEFVILSMIFNLSYFPKYYYRKYSGVIKLNKVLLQPIIWKNIFLGLLVIINYKILLVLLFVNIITLFEFIIGKYLSGKQYEFNN